MSLTTFIIGAMVLFVGYVLGYVAADYKRWNEERETYLAWKRAEMRRSHMRHPSNVHLVEFGRGDGDVA